ncbi:DUF6156 family protein [Azonexus sp. IMCC34839]|uniref:DUF6156 family protein n=1 Tax=Azonexus sp. IMCC34839 TaxID=3133695 RepID=UPI00399B5FB5
MTRPATTRYFTSYSGTKLPLNLVGEIDAASMNNRNTYFRGSYDASGQLVSCEKVVYGEIELRHDYHYHADGRLARAEIDDGSGDSNVIDYPA